MNSEVTNVLSPINADGGIDLRFKGDQQWIIEQIGPEVIDALRDFKQKTSDLEKQYPGMQERLCDSDGSIRKFINIYVNEEDIRFMDAEKTSITNEDTVSIIPAIAGGI